VAFHLSRTYSVYLVGRKVEGGIILILSLFWASIVAVVSNARNGVAINPDQDNTVANGNLYYFSWAGFVTSILLFVTYLKSIFGLDLVGEMQSRAARLTVWAGMLACQLVVMGSSANIYDKDCVPQSQSDAYCSRTSYGIALGCIGTLSALGIVAIKMVTKVAPYVIEVSLALLLLILNTFGVAFITSADGPGSPIGNLYYFSWLSFLCIMYIVSKCYEEYRSAPERTVDEPSDGDPDSQGIPDVDEI
jgi:hypothetical protein